MDPYVPKEPSTLTVSPDHREQSSLRTVYQDVFDNSILFFMIVLCGSLCFLCVSL